MTSGKWQTVRHRPPAGSFRPVLRRAMGRSQGTSRQRRLSAGSWPTSVGNRCGCEKPRHFRIRTPTGNVHTPTRLRTHGRKPAVHQIVRCTAALSNGRCGSSLRRYSRRSGRLPHRTLGQRYVASCYVLSLGCACSLCLPRGRPKASYVGPSILSWPM